MGRSNLNAVILDAGALIALESRQRKIGVILQRAKDLGSPIFIPAPVLARVWRDGARQARLSALLGSRGVRVANLTEALAKSVGELCGRRETSDLVDAAVVLVARQHVGIVVTGDQSNIRRLDPALEIISL